MEILRFIFESFWHFVGTLILLSVVFVAPFSMIAEAIARKTRAHKEIVKMMEEYKRLKGL